MAQVLLPSCGARGSEQSTAGSHGLRRGCFHRAVSVDRSCIFRRLLLCSHISILGLGTLLYFLRVESLMNIALQPGVEQLKLLRNKDISPVELAEEHIRRIERLNPALN